MRTLLAIFLILLTVLPHPALFASAVHRDPACGGGKACSCCPEGACQCALNESDLPAVPPSPAVPVSGADFYPVAAMPPLQITGFLEGPALPERKSQISPLVPALLRAAGVPLFVRHQAFLL
jgi:hypothetical protein